MSAPMPILHRAMVDAPDPQHLGPLYAFVAAHTPEAARSKLEHMLPPLLCAHTHRIRVVFPMSELELLQRAEGELTDGDARLLEIGRRRPGGPLAYAEASRTLLLLPPPLLQRMQAAQHRARALS